MANKFTSKIKSLITHFAESISLSWRSSSYMFILRIIFEVFTILAPILLANLLKLVMNLFLNQDVTDEYMLGTFAILMLSIVIVRILNILFDSLNKIFSDNHNELINKNIEVMILEKINDLDISYFDTPNYHNEVTNVYNDGKALQSLAFMVISVIRALMQIVVYSLILFQVSIFIPMLVIILLIPAVLIDNYVLKKRYIWEQESTLERRKISYLKSILNGQNFAKDIRIFHTKDYFFNKYLCNWNEWFTKKRRIYRKGTLSSTVSKLIPHIAVYSLLFIVGIKVINNDLTVGDFTYYNGIIIPFVGGVTALFSSINKSYESEQKLSQFSSFMNKKPTIECGGDIEIDTINNIEFRNVSFKYPNTSKNIFNNISFKLETGKITALVGKNGAGKSTIVKLILRLYEPSNGEILVNGINIKQIDQKSLHKAIGVVFQDYNTYELTLREDVAISDIERRINDREIIDACEKAGFSTKSEQLVDGLDTYVGKKFDVNGVILSGGQKQKLAISSSYFKNASYYIMDEPNSALDPIAESELIAKLESLSQNNGALFITHKLSIMRFVDEIIVMDEGNIVERGNHHELLRNNKLYSSLYYAQANKYGADDL